MTHHSHGTGAVHTVWDHALPPALTVGSGDTVTLHTLDASDGGVARRVANGELNAPPELLPLIVADAHPERPGPRGHP
ncbi:hypothetical protein ACFQDE_14560 [Deinococcus caeni]